LSYVTVDPSPTKRWAVQWWVYQEQSKLRYLMDVFAGPMQAGEFLDELEDGTHVGLAEQFQQRSVDLGFPISASGSWSRTRRRGSCCRSVTCSGGRRGTR
jgi:hypothetical protein